MEINEKQKRKEQIMREIVKELLSKPAPKNRSSK